MALCLAWSAQLVSLAWPSPGCDLLLIFTVVGGSVFLSAPRFPLFCVGSSSHCDWPAAVGSHVPPRMLAILVTLIYTLSCLFRSCWLGVLLLFIGFIVSLVCVQWSWTVCVCEVAEMEQDLCDIATAASMR